MTLFADLKKAIGTEWTDYTEHEFVLGGKIKPK